MDWSGLKSVSKLLFVLKELEILSIKDYLASWHDVVNKPYPHARPKDTST